MSDDMDTCVRQFIGVRDVIKKLEEEHKAVLKPWRGRLEILSGKIQAFMDANKLENLKTKAGTAYTTVRRTASLADPDAFMTYVIETKSFDLLDRRANSTAVQAFVDQHKALPPGCNLNSAATVGVRRAGATEE